MAKEPLAATQDISTSKKPALCGYARNSEPPSPSAAVLPKRQADTQDIFSVRLDQRNLVLAKTL